MDENVDMELYTKLLPELEGSSCRSEAMARALVALGRITGAPCSEEQIDTVFDRVRLSGREIIAIRAVMDTLGLPSELEES